MSLFFIEFLEDKLEVFKVRGLALYLFKDKLKIPFKFFLGHINKSFKVTKIFLKQSFKLYSKQKIYLVSVFILVEIKANILSKKKKINKVCFDLVVPLISK